MTLTPCRLAPKHPLPRNVSIINIKTDLKCPLSNDALSGQEELQQSPHSAPTIHLQWSFCAEFPRGPSTWTGGGITLQHSEFAPSELRQCLLYSKICALFNRKWILQNGKWLWNGEALLQKGPSLCLYSCIYPFLVLASESRCKVYEMCSMRLHICLIKSNFSHGCSTDLEAGNAALVMSQKLANQQLPQPQIYLGDQA